MDTDDLEPKRPTLEPKDLDLMGVEELQDYLDELKAEVARVEAKIGTKSDYKSSAESFFKS
jgi:uncharacterized small protein (DUF1192 family)